jgi:hypothetical protein
MRCFGNYGCLPGQAARRGRRLVVGVTENVGVVEAPVPDKPLRVDGQPAARAKVENIAVVDVSM